VHSDGWVWRSMLTRTSSMASRIVGSLASAIFKF
jgi:hypothetical protein